MLGNPAELRERLRMNGRSMVWRRAVSLNPNGGGADPRILRTNYEQMVADDSIRVSLVPEKEGINLKHAIYEVSSQVGGCRCAAFSRA